MRRLLITLSVFGMVACGSNPKVPAESKAVNLPPDFTQMGRQELTNYYSFENLDVGRGPPQVGIALSGGGTRAAYFALGVLSGLNDSKLIDHIDIISSVSGGGYTAYWLYTQRYRAATEHWDYHAIFADCFPAWLADPRHNDPNIAAIPAAWEAIENHANKRLSNECKTSSLHYILNLHIASTEGDSDIDDPFRWQAYLARYPALFIDKPVTLSGVPPKRRSFLTVSRAFALGENILLNFFRHKKSSQSADWYRDGIQRTWGFSPTPRNLTDSESNTAEDTPYDWKSAISIEPSFQQLAQFMRGPKDSEGPKVNTSFPMWVINARIGDKTAAPDPSAIFEMTPFGYGSTVTGYRLGYLPDMPVLQAVTLSAAFVDAQNAEQGTSLHIAGELANFLTNGEARWGQDVHMPDFMPNVQHVSDGGGEDNLGVISLVRRGVPNIIIVDGEADPAGRLPALCRIREALKPNMSLVIGKLSHLDQVCDPQFSQPTWPSKGYNTSEWLNPVLTGEIRPLDPSKGSALIHIWYIKLAWNQLAYREAFNAMQCEIPAHDVSCFLTIFYGENSSITNNDGRDGWMWFPQISTVGMVIDSSSYLFWAYRELGREAGRELTWNLNLSTIDTHNSQCAQAPMPSPRSDLRSGSILADKAKAPACP